ncbi:MAG: TRAP-type C4-dicarboxylate transport system, large permease component, partial [uncultured Acetobacteraceae bacterium]
DLPRPARGADRAALPRHADVRGAVPAAAGGAAVRRGRRAGAGRDGDRQARRLPAGRHPAVHADGARDGARARDRRPLRRRLRPAAARARRSRHRHRRGLHGVRRDLRLLGGHRAHRRQVRHPADAALRHVAARRLRRGGGRRDAGHPDPALRADGALRLRHRGLGRGAVPGRHRARLDDGGHVRRLGLRHRGPRPRAGRRAAARARGRGHPPLALVPVAAGVRAGRHLLRRVHRDGGGGHRHALRHPRRGAGLPRADPAGLPGRRGGGDAHLLHAADDHRGRGHLRLHADQAAGAAGAGGAGGGVGPDAHRLPGGDDGAAVPARPGAGKLLHHPADHARHPAGDGHARHRQGLVRHPADAQPGDGADQPAGCDEPRGDQGHHWRAAVRGEPEHHAVHADAGPGHGAADRLPWHRALAAAAGGVPGV